MKYIYLNNIVYYLTGAAVICFIISYFFVVFFTIALLILLLLALALVIDVGLLYTSNKALTVTRTVADRLSLGDENSITLTIFNNYSFRVKIVIEDELPNQFQARDWQRHMTVAAKDTALLVYTIKPLSRGEYTFYNVNVFIAGLLGLVSRRLIIPATYTAKVYPSVMQMKKYQLLAVGSRLQEAGVKKIRRIGQSMEFEQIKEYVRGDDYRSINWKATARRRDVLMTNTYSDERSQQIYCLINTGRVMKMPFEGLSLLDYSINSALVLSNTALIKQDKAGLLTFSRKVEQFITADKKVQQLNQLLEALYREETQFPEADYELLYAAVKQKIAQRALLILYTNFESIEGLERAMPALKKIAKHHLLLVVLFENTELQNLSRNQVSSTEELYIKTIGEKFILEKKLMVRELQKNGIMSILTPPDKLTINTLNKYLELKSRLSI